jgi:hypothetical protein
VLPCGISLCFIDDLVEGLSASIATTSQQIEMDTDLSEIHQTHKPHGVFKKMKLVVSIGLRGRKISHSICSAGNIECSVKKKRSECSMELSTEEISIIYNSLHFFSTVLLLLFSILLFFSLKR